MLTPSTPDWTKAASHLDDIERYYASFNGKTGHNPHWMLQNTIQPLRESILTGETSLEIYDKIMALKKEPPVIKSLFKLDEAVEKKINEKAVIASTTPSK